MSNTLLRICLFASFIGLASTLRALHAQNRANTNVDHRFDVDMTGVDLFWQITDILSRDEAPDSALWRGLFTSPGYAALKNDERLRSNIELVFRPSNADQLNKTHAEANYWRRRDLEHLIAVRSTRAELRAFQKSINIDDAIHQGIREAAAFLPEGATNAPPPPIRFVIFSPDARVMGGTIIFDLAHTRNLGFDLLAKTMGHEFHHFFMASVSRFSPPAPTSSYHPLVRAIGQLQVEGVADLIDKFAVDSARAGDPDWRQQWSVPFAATTQRLAELDSLMVELRSDSTHLLAHGKRALNELFPMAGHPNGNAMARLILKHHGRDAVIGSLGNPFEFFRLYHDAARSSGEGHMFSAGALEYLHRLEHMFTR